MNRLHRRSGDRGQDPCQHGFGVDLGCERLVGQHQSVAQDLGGDVVDVLWHRVVAAAHQRHRPTGTNQAEAGSRAGSELDERCEVGQAVVLRCTRREHEVDGVLQHGPVAIDRLGVSLQGGHISQRQHLVGLGRRHPHAVHDLEFLGRARISEDDLHEEPVALGFGEGIDPLVLDRVLGGQHEERVRGRVGLAADRHVAFGHHLEQRALHLGRRSVDLIGEKEVGENRTEFDIELLGGGAKDPGADDVGGQQVGGELDPVERAADGAGHRLHRQGLGEARDAFQQAVTVGDETHDHPLDRPLLADHDLAHLEQETFQHLMGGGGVAGWCRRIVG